MSSLCPPDWSGVGSPSSPSEFGYATGSCDGAIIFTGRFGMDTFTCFYDATTQALIGQAHTTDASAYCGNTSSCISAGVLPGGSICTPGYDGFVLGKSCTLDGGMPDGG